jgi:hypothetical protein
MPPWYGGETMVLLLNRTSTFDPHRIWWGNLQKLKGDSCRRWMGRRIPGLQSMRAFTWAGRLASETTAGASRAANDWVGSRGTT